MAERRPLVLIDGTPRELPSGDSLPSSGAWQSVSSNHTAATGDRLLCDTSSAPFNVTLPGSPGVYDVVEIADASGAFATNPVTIARNGSLIMGLDENLSLDYSRLSIRLIYSGSTYGWVIA